MGAFLHAYLRRIAGGIWADFDDNHDPYRFGPAAAPSHASRGWLRRLVRRSGVLVLPRAYRCVHPHRDHLEWLHRNLADDESRRLLVDLVAYRVLGPRKIRLPLSRPDYWQAIRAAEAGLVPAEAVDLGFQGLRGWMMDMARYGFPLRVLAGPQNAVTLFDLQQYRCITPDGEIRVRPGDVVIDGGGCHGDTALYFAHLAGPEGKVYSFEFLPENVARWRMCVGLNPALAPGIRLVENPLWSASGVELAIVGTGPATRVLPVADAPEGEGRRVATVAIDDLVEREAPGSVDFVKMDIEGSEPAALAGAERTLRRFRPRLAITVYHALEHFWEIPRWIDGLGLGYRFHLRHFTIHQEETVLFAECPGRGEPGGG